MIYDCIDFKLSSGLINGTDSYDIDIGDGLNIEVDGCWRVDQVCDWVMIKKTEHDKMSRLTKYISINFIIKRLRQ